MPARYAPGAAGRPAWVGVRGGGPAPRTPRWEATASQTLGQMARMGEGHGAPIATVPPTSPSPILAIRFTQVRGHVCPRREGSGGQSPPDAPTLTA